MEEIEIQPVRNTRLRKVIFELFYLRRQLKRHIIILDNTNTKHPKPFNKIYKENLLRLSYTEIKLRDHIQLLKSLC